MTGRPWHASWPCGLARSLDYPPVTVPALLESAARRVPDRPAIVFQIGGGVTTYARLWDDARRFAAALVALGLRKGDRVAIHLPNSPQFALAYYGALLAGAVATPASPLLTPRELAHQLADAGAETLVTLDLFLETVDSARQAAPVERVIVTGLQEVLPPRTPVDARPFGPQAHSLLALLAAAPDRPPAVSIDPAGDLAHLIYTGGTTGVSKGVMLTHRAVVVNTLQYAHWAAGGSPRLGPDGTLRFGRRAADADRADWDYPVEPDAWSALIVVPWAHSMGLVAYLDLPVYTGGTMYVHPRFDAAAYTQDIVRHRVEVFGGAPSLLQGVIAQPGVEDLDFSSVRWIPSGAAPLPPAVAAAIRRLVPGAILMEAYGLTEMTMGATANPAHRTGRREPGSVGLPVFDTDIKVVDAGDPGRELAPGEVGEICLRGPQAMLGYWRRPDETAEVMRNGWIHTGDIGRLGAGGYLYVVDRKKDLLIYKGYNVYPRELEDILAAHPAVAQCAVVGRPDPAAGEAPKAFVVRRPGLAVTEGDLLAFVAARVAPYKKVREIEFVTEIPQSPAGKPLRRLLRG